jgi:hypothetical protein
MGVEDPGSDEDWYRREVQDVDGPGDLISIVMAAVDARSDGDPLVGHVRYDSHISGVTEPTVIEVGRTRSDAWSARLYLRTGAVVNGEQAERQYGEITIQVNNR